MWLLQKPGRQPFVTGIHGLRCWLDPSKGLHLEVDWRGAEKLRAVNVLLRQGSGAVVVELGTDTMAVGDQISSSQQDRLQPDPPRFFKFLRVEGRGPGGPSAAVRISDVGETACIIVPLECCSDFVDFCERGLSSGEAVLGGGTVSIKFDGHPEPPTAP